MHLRLLVLIVSIASQVLADVKFTEPDAGSTYKAGTVLTVSWQESGQKPPISELTNYVLSLCAGGNSDSSFECSYGVLKSGGTFGGSNEATGLKPIAAAVGGNSENGYFLQMQSTTSTGGQVFDYSSRFGLTGMEGSFDPTIQAAINKLGGSTSGPPSSYQKGDSVAVPSVDASAGAFGIPYSQQTGLTRYCPMQPRPSKTITAKSAKRLFPTSHVVLAKSWLPSPSVMTTVTQPENFSPPAHVNHASPAPNPNDAMAKFLARWKD